MKKNTILLSNSRRRNFFQVFHAPLFQELQNRRRLWPNRDVGHQGEILHQANSTTLKLITSSPFLSLLQYHDHNANSCLINTNRERKNSECTWWRKKWNWTSQIPFWNSLWNLLKQEFQERTTLSNSVLDGDMLPDWLEGSTCSMDYEPPPFYTGTLTHKCSSAQSIELYQCIINSLIL